jgi:hypothetical protein
MYNDLKEWLNIPVEWKQFISHDGRGNETYADPVIKYCYLDGKISRIRNEKDEVIVSNQILYFSGEDGKDMSINDVFVINASEKSPVHLQPYYNEKGNLSLLGVYL